MEEEKLLYTLKIALFSALLLFDLKAFSLNLEGFQTLRDPKSIELASTIDSQFKKAAKDQGDAVNPTNQYLAQSFNNKELNQEQKALVRQVDKKSKEHLRQEFCARDKNSHETEFTRGNLKSNAELYVFITLGMKPNNIQSLIKEAKRYGAKVVIRGLKDNSFMETAQFLRKIAKEASEGVIIDPTLFRKYNIQIVPTFILAKNHTLFEGEKYDLAYDQLEGNITIQYALEKMKANGDLAQVAEEILK